MATATIKKDAVLNMLYIRLSMDDRRHLLRVKEVLSRIGSRKSEVDDRRSCRQRTFCTQDTIIPVCGMSWVGKCPKVTIAKAGHRAWHDLDPYLPSPRPRRPPCTNKRTSSA